LIFLVDIVFAEVAARLYLDDQLVDERVLAVAD
jgi:hypothetical protein